MSRGHVTHLVAHHHGELGLRVEVGEDAPGHVDEPAREGERVHRRVVDEAKGPGELGAFRPLGNGVPQARHVVLQRRVVVHAERGHRLLVFLLSEGDLLPLADQHELLPAGGGVGGAGAEDDQHDQDGGSATPEATHEYPLERCRPC